MHGQTTGEETPHGGAPPNRPLGEGGVPAAAKPSWLSLKPLTVM